LANDDLIHNFDFVKIMGSKNNVVRVRVGETRTTPRKMRG